MSKRDGLAGLSFLQALAPFNYPTSTAHSGVSIDLRGYNECTFVVQIGSGLGGSAVAWTAQYWNIVMEHGLDDGAGAPSSWSIVGLQNVLHSVMGSGGTISAITSGIVMTMASTELDTVKVVGYRGDTTHRWVRVRLSETGDASVTFFNVTAVLGRPSQWPVIEAAGN